MNDPIDYNATIPLKAVDSNRRVVDADGDSVVTCSTATLRTCGLYKERLIEADHLFCCPKCGRSGDRMEEVSVDQLIYMQQSFGLPIYLCRIKLPIPMKLVYELTSYYKGDNYRMKEEHGYLCFYEVEPSDNHDNQD